ncbi:hypothetical protein SLS62_002138 [Diatrype stigma]|uniref:Uncharacterized protein n=1 Tax=Diatrype stigma TaxID=117547 RepID=A0AAN9YV79_9PEZI
MEPETPPPAYPNGPLAGEEADEEPDQQAPIRSPPVDPHERINIDARNRLTGRNETRFTANLGEMGDRFVNYRPEDGLAMVDNRVQRVLEVLNILAADTQVLQDQIEDVADTMHRITAKLNDEDKWQHIDREIEGLRIMMDAGLCELEATFEKTRSQSEKTLSQREESLLQREEKVLQLENSIGSMALFTVIVVCAAGCYWAYCMAYW